MSTVNDPEIIAWLESPEGDSWRLCSIKRAPPILVSFKPVMGEEIKYGGDDLLWVLEARAGVIEDTRWVTEDTAEHRYA